MDIHDSQRIKEIRDNTRAIAEAFGRIANTLADALELYISTQTETQNSNLAFEKDECAEEYEELGLKELKELIEADRKTEPTISKMEQVDDDAPSIDIVRCKECKHNHDGTCEYADTPQTEKASCETCRYYMMPWNGGECDGCCAGYDGKPSNYEPQTEREGE